MSPGASSRSTHACATTTGVRQGASRVRRRLAYRCSYVEEVDLTSGDVASGPDRPRAPSGLMSGCGRRCHGCCRWPACSVRAAPRASLSLPRADALHRGEMRFCGMIKSLSLAVKKCGSVRPIASGVSELRFHGRPAIPTRTAAFLRKCPVRLILTALSARADRSLCRQQLGGRQPLGDSLRALRAPARPRRRRPAPEG